MNFLAMTLGSLGDFFPFLAIAQRLRNRGHRVVLASNAGYAALAEMAGIEFVAIWHGSTQNLDGLITRDPARAWAVVHREMFEQATGFAWDCIRRYTGEGRWIMLASWNVMAAAQAHEKAGIPFCKIYLSPGGIANDESQRMDNVGLRNIGLFPNWFARTHFAQTGFAMIEDDAIPQLSPEAEKFLQAGPAPLVFTPGSFMRDAARFFREALAASNQLGLRSVFLTPYREQVPPQLPASVRHFSYLPLQRLVPRSAALVHHGGVGTLAQGLKGGVPQLVMPLFFDQPDNAERLEGLGVSATLPTSAWAANAISEKLDTLLRSEEIKLNCARIAGRFGQNDAVEDTCNIALSAAR